MSTPSTYGLNGPLRAPAPTGQSLISMGQGTQQAGMQTLAASAEQEQQREIANKQQKQANKAGMAQLGSTVGAVAGFAVGGPSGSMSGGALGGIAAGALG